MRIVVIEDHQMFREVLVKLFTESECEVIGETNSGAQGLALIKERLPDLAVLDLHIDDLDGFQLLNRLAEISAKPRILIVSAYCDRYTAARLDRHRVHGFVDKGASLNELRKAVNALKAGLTHFSQRYCSVRFAHVTDPNAFSKLLSEWEQVILTLIGKGYSDAEIAERLIMSVRTAKTHRSRLMHKLSVTNTPKLMAYAVENGFTRFAGSSTSGPASSGANETP